jgi:hypothetical protein
MKKLLILMLVLGMTSMASALVDLKISVTLDPYGTPTYIEDPRDSEIELEESDIIWIDIHGTVTADEPTPVYLIAQGQGTLTGGQLLQGDGTHVEIDPAEELDLGYTWGDFFADEGYPDVGPLINEITFLDSTVPFEDLVGVLFDFKEFHCTNGDPPNDVVITLLNANDYPFTVLDRLVIHQIPEPMTIALLGLGGLFLRRRK